MAFAFALDNHRWLRGLGALPVAIAASIAALWGMQDLLQTFVAPQRTWTSLAPAVAWHAWNSVLAFAALTPLLLFVGFALDVPNRRHATGVALVAAVALGAATCAALYPLLGCTVHWMRDPDCAHLGWMPHWIHMQIFMRVAVWGGLLAMVLHLAEQEHASVQARHAEQVTALRARQEEAEATLQSLQAQIEPHFLFNTLAHVQRFHATDPEKGQVMLSSLIAYMEAALPRMRERLGTMADEIALVRAYVRVQQMRMGERLRFHDDVAPQVLKALVPPVSVLTLAENAIKHGLGPKGGGGTLTIMARELQGELIVEVSDDGVGLRATGGNGRGLANTRARLETLFGPDARLSVASGDQGGVRAVMRLPILARAGA